MPLAPFCQEYIYIPLSSAPWARAHTLDGLQRPPPLLLLLLLLQYLGFLEDVMLVLFLLCILVALITVHKGSCYRSGSCAVKAAERRG